jgi:zinc transporter 1
LGIDSSLLEHSHSHGHSHGHDHSEKPTGIEQVVPAVASADRSQEAHESRRSSSTLETRNEDSTSSPQTSGTPYLHGNGHPAAVRASVIEAGVRLSHELNATHRPNSSPRKARDSHSHSHSHGGHSHGSMNMRALMLHVMGDAGGNLAVISSGLVMWLTNWSFRFYFDPTVSLLFAIIIFIGAIPLVRSACLVLLQAAPPHVSVESVRDSILSVHGVISLHELHVWQLSENKAIASVHITTLCDERAFMTVAADIKKKLHELGIHSCTIQPEYKFQSDSLRRRLTTAHEGDEDNTSNHSDDTLCMLRCPEDLSCDPAENACCPPNLIRVEALQEV